MATSHGDTVYVSVDLRLTGGQYDALLTLMDRHHKTQNTIVQRAFNLGLVILYEYAKLTRQAQESERAAAAGSAKAADDRSG